MPKASEVEVTESKKDVKFKRPNIWLYVVLGVFGIVLVFMAGAGIASHHQHYEMSTFGGGARGYGMGGGSSGGERVMMRMGGPARDGGSITINGQTRTEGVVTNVSGSSFTIAGHGSTTDVTTSSSTQYQNGNQVKQNDTVLVFGTTSNNVLNATNIAINP